MTFSAAQTTTVRARSEQRLKALHQGTPVLTHSMAEVHATRTRRCLCHPYAGVFETILCRRAHMPISLTPTESNANAPWRSRATPPGGCSALKADACRIHMLGLTHMECQQVEERASGIAAPLSRPGAPHYGDPRTRERTPPATRAAHRGSTSRTNWTCCEPCAASCWPPPSSRRNHDVTLTITLSEEFST